MPYMSESVPHETRRCQICGSTERSHLRRVAVIRPVLQKLMEKDVEQWQESGWICLDDIQKYQQRYVNDLLRKEKGELTDLENEVLKDLHDHEVTAKNPLKEDEEDNPTFGERLADRIASFGGSWRFIITFCCLLGIWVLVNVYVLAAHPFDPYPFILLNLFLSALASLQAPLIMMSQNRQESRDRLRALHDYQVNLKAELEIRQLHQKIDHMLSHQWERLLEIQEIQIELINEIRAKK